MSGSVTQVDCGKLQAHLRRLRRKDLLHLLDRAIDLLPQARLIPSMAGYFDPKQMKSGGTTKGELLVSVRTFRESSLRGDCYEDFFVNSKNYMKLSVSCSICSDDWMWVIRL